MNIYQLIYYSVSRTLVTVVSFSTVHYALWKEEDIAKILFLFMNFFFIFLLEEILKEYFEG